MNLTIEFKCKSWKDGEKERREINGKLENRFCFVVSREY